MPSMTVSKYPPWLKRSCPGVTDTDMPSATGVYSNGESKGLKKDGAAFDIGLKGFLGAGLADVVTRRNGFGF